MRTGLRISYIVAGIFTVLGAVYVTKGQPGMGLLYMTAGVIWGISAIAAMARTPRGTGTRRPTKNPLPPASGERNRANRNY